MANQIRLLVWKNLLIRRNRYIATTAEVALPMLLLLLLNTALTRQEATIDSDPIEFKAYKQTNCTQKKSHYDSIVYEPSTPFTRLLMTQAACFAGYKKSNVKTGSLSDNNTYFSIGVRFDVPNDTTTVHVLNYTLFPTHRAFENSKNLWRFYVNSVPKFSTQTMFSVVELQRAIDSSYLHLRNISTPKVLLENTDVFDRSPKVLSIGIFLTLFMAISLMVPPIVSRIVEERQTGAKELMLMMGVDRWQLWISKFIDVVIFVGITVTGMVLFLCLPLRADSAYVRISPLVLWPLLMYGFVGVTLFLFCLSCIFQKPTRAVFATEVIWAASFLMQYPIFGLFRLPRFFRYAYAFWCPHVSLMTGVAILLSFDDYEKEIKLTERLSGRLDTFSLLDVLLMTMGSIVLYSSLIWYLELVIPGKFGVPLPYNFFLKKSYWVPRKIVTTYGGWGKRKRPETFERVSDCLKPMVRLEGVTKEYKSNGQGAVVAVDDVSVEFYACEISGLLGHNGAGKTTLLSMITGMSYPTSGRIMVSGCDLARKLRKAKRNVGYCPQQDVLLNDLTPVQTLQFYGLVKGMSLKFAKEDADHLIVKLKLTDVKNIQASKLSGGQRRKLSLAITIIGENDIIVLDEPTAGMDVEIRREIWEILRGIRLQRTILLTTHFMEEADALCDRIAIMDHGKIKCFGSPMFLKSKYGKGYLLSVVVPDTDKSKELVNYIKKFADAKFVSQNIRTLRFQLAESDVSHFGSLFSGLDEKQAAGEITSYSISFSTLEDAFLGLKSGQEETNGFDFVDSPEYQDLDDPGKGKVGSCCLFVNQFWALILKKFIYFGRNFKLYCFYTMLPCFLFLVMKFSLNNKNPKGDVIGGKVSLTYSLDLYPSSLVLYSMPWHVSVEETLFKSMVNSSGSTARKVDDVNKAISNMFRDDFHEYARKLILAFDFTQNFRIYHNHDAVHMVPVALNFFHNYLLKYYYSDDGIVTSINTTYTNKKAFVVPRATEACPWLLQSAPDVLGVYTLFYLFGPIRERFFGAKDLQLMLTSVPLYWLSHLVFDLAAFSTCLMGFLMGMAITLDDTSNMLANYAGEIFFGIWFWGGGLILIQYIFSTLIKNSATALSFSLMTHIIFSFSSYDVIQFEGALSFVKYLHPSYFLKSGINSWCSGEKSTVVLNLFLYCCMLFLVLIVKDSQIFSRAGHSLINRFLKVDYSMKEEKDELVEEEEERVRKSTDKGNSLVVKELRRWYWRRFRPSPAVRGISFAVRRGECFGLLGVNGAGKTTTFRILTGTIPASDGSSCIYSERLSLWNRQKYLFSVGYCPQFGGLIPIFRGAELLEIFARLKGVPGSRAKMETLKWIEKLGLLEYANKNCETYSGGNQRKLCTAIALVGESPLIFLDEPTTGVDPVSRRTMWNAIKDLQKEGRSVVLTSHSMDECEALCSRLAIMMKGRFRCVGETTTLKDRFGQGYSVQLKLSSRASQEDVESLKKKVAEAFESDCKLVDDHVTILQYHLTNEQITWEILFRKLNQLKEESSILESYTANATTLEQIFIYFARSDGETV